MTKRNSIKNFYPAALVAKAWELNKPSIVKTADALYDDRTKHVNAGIEIPRPSRQLVRRWLAKMGLLDHSAKQVLPSIGELASGKVKILTLDIETAPLLAAVWGLWKQNVGLNQISHEWTILSYCAKWLHEDDPIYDDCRGSPRDDKHLLSQLWNLLDEADIIITQNGKRFDVPKINARFIMSGFRPPRPFKHIDTLMIAKQNFAFTSRRLEWMTDKLCERHKKNKHAKFPGFALWDQCMKDNPEAWDEMAEYNIPDVLSTEELYLIMRPWFVGHPNVAIFFEDDKPTLRCPKCASKDVKGDDTPHYTQSGKYERIYCNSCHGWSRGRYTLNTLPMRRVQLSN